MRPVSFSDHAIRRYVERWCTPRKTVDRQYALSHLTAMLLLVQHVEDLPDENQSIWSLCLSDVSDPHDTRPDALLVVDDVGVVRTVLPPHAKRPPGRGKGRYK